jgi:hypothetical protein
MRKLAALRSGRKVDHIATSVGVKEEKGMGRDEASPIP